MPSKIWCIEVMMKFPYDHPIAGESKYRYFTHLLNYHTMLEDTPNSILN
jgi:hypothetical protein